VPEHAPERPPERPPDATRNSSSPGLGATAGAAGQQDAARRAAQPMFNAPTVIIALLGCLIAVHLARQLLSEDQDEWLVVALAFIPARFTAMGWMLPGGTLARFTSPLTHLFLHADAAHLLINGAWLLAMGSIIARRVGAARLLALLAVCGMAGALAFWAVNPRLAQPVIGASGAESGLMGALVRFLFVAVNHGLGPVLRETPGAIPRASLMDVLRDRRALAMIASVVVMNLLFAFGLGKLLNAGGIAWEAHLGGFAAGLLLFQWFDRPDGGGTLEAAYDIADAMAPAPQPTD
jgi:membrane associated rhomboid family serine protease